MLPLLIIVGLIAQAPTSAIIPGGSGGGSGVTSITTSAPITGGPITTTGNLACTAATASVPGCLAAADWTTFNNKLTSFNGRTTAAAVPVTGDYNIPYSAPAGTPQYTISIADQGRAIGDANLGLWRLPTIASVSAGFYVYLVNNSSANGATVQVTDGATINGQGFGLFNFPVGSNVMMLCDGVGWLAFGNVAFAATSTRDGASGGFPGAPQGSQDLPLQGSLAFGTSTVGRFTAQTAAKTVLTKTSTIATDESYLLSANVNITTATANSFTVTATYTDDTNTSQTLTLPFVSLAGTVLTTLTNVTGAGPYEGVPVHIRCKANTTIVIASVGTFTTVAYNIEAHIRHIK